MSDKILIDLYWNPCEKSSGTIEVAKLEIQEVIDRFDLKSIEYDFDDEDDNGFLFWVSGTYEDLEIFLTCDLSYEDKVENYLSVRNK